MPLPQEVSALVTDRLSAVDAALPGFVTALWVTGSAASGDWRPGRSDVDFVAATSRVPELADLEALAALHAGGGEIHYDGLYVPAADLHAPPSAEETAAHVVDGEFASGPCGYCTPVTWLELRQDGSAVRGPVPGTLVAAPDPAALRRWLLGNLRGYWSGEAAQAERVTAERPPEAAVGGGPVVWLTLGAARLHATLATGRVVSKTATGAYVAEHFPAYAELAKRCVAWRAGEDVGFTMADGAAAAALVRDVVSSAGAAG
ncbi:MAG TPA: nucleotidyltransferase domain-containing protein [Mycobacteriales bacterium]|nr:nucleotidyltransferase domain-containing protein [Mycobacteriales bacterium]